MKKLILLLAFLLFTISFSFSQVLELNLTVGESYYHDTESQVTMTQELHGESFISDISYGGKMSFLVKEKIDSVYHLEVRFLTMYLKVNTNGNEISANSQKVDSTDILSLLLNELTKSPFYISIMKYGIVKEVKMEKIFDNLFSFNPDIPKLEKARMIYMLKQSFGEKAMKGSMEMLTAIYPKSPVKEGDRWKNKIRLETVSGVTMENEFVLKELNKDFAIINSQSKTISDDNNSFIKIKGELLRFNSIGNMTSTFKIDKNTGWIKESEIKQSISGMNEKKWREESEIILKIPFEYVGSIIVENE
ncbi:DUF6263 family protein [Aequorivita vladivostokensis]|uniref:DUF6263 family protein n=1 Tax=Aequorivita vladivostokensis TaxID=171194 RepID=UPI00103B6A8B|nr:DUF6263 family protein [Aequorivita vladivostokensis]